MPNSIKNQKNDTMLNIFVSIHIIAGTIALLSGTIAMIFKKGGRYHRKSGNAFFVSMLIMGATAAGLAIYVSKPLSVVGGVLACYLVATSWITAIQKEGEAGVFEKIAMFVALMTTVFADYIGVKVLKSETPIYEGSSASPGPYFFFGSIALLAAIFDMKVIRSGGAFGKHRILRHLWRMCFAFFIAAASLFLGQPQVFPKAIRGTLILFLPVLLVLVSLIYWLIRVQFRKRPKTI